MVPEYAEDMEIDSSIVQRGRQIVSDRPVENVDHVARRDDDRVFTSEERQCGYHIGPDVGPAEVVVSELRNHVGRHMNLLKEAVAGVGWCERLTQARFSCSRVKR